LLNLTIKQRDSARAAAQLSLSSLSWLPTLSPAMRVRVTRAQPSNDALLGGVDGAVQPAHRVAGLVAGPAPAVGLVVQPQLS